MLLSAVQNNYKCFAYSGELPNYLFKSWFYLQAAGPANLTEEWSKWNTEKPKVIPKKINAKLDRWFKSKLWIYDNSKIMSEGEESLCRIIEKVCIQYLLPTP